MTQSTWQLGGRTINRLGYGAMRITGPGIWGYPADRDEAIAVLRRAKELGVNLIDTADSYGPSVSEELIFEALHPFGDIVVATKAGLLRTGPDVWVPCGIPDYLRQECELSLRRLGQESLDLFQLHRVDPKVRAEDQYGLLAELLNEGKIRAVGLSEVSVEQIKEAQKIVPVSSVQNLYNVSNRSSEDVVDYCENERIAFIPWFPVASGALARPGGALDKIAHSHGASVAQLSLAWLLRRSSVVLPIPGTSKVAHVEENCASATIELDDDTFAAISEVAR
jgi:aryl-alcohol dehydrogenase-like predicted oxidoreductase